RSPAERNTLGVVHEWPCTGARWDDRTVCGCQRLLAVQSGRRINCGIRRVCILLDAGTRAFLEPAAGAFLEPAAGTFLEPCAIRVYAGAWAFLEPATGAFLEPATFGKPETTGSAVHLLEIKCVPVIEACEWHVTNDAVVIKVQPRICNRGRNHQVVVPIEWHREVTSRPYRAFHPYPGVFAWIFRRSK